MSLVRVQSEEPNLKKPAFEQAFCFRFSCGLTRFTALLPRGKSGNLFGEKINFLRRVIKSQRRPDGTLIAQTTQDRLRTVMPGPHSDANLTEIAPHGFIFMPRQHKRQDAGFVRRGADQRQARIADSFAIPYSSKACSYCAIFSIPSEVT